MELSELDVEPFDYINSVATKVAQIKKPGEKVYVRLVHEGQQLPPECQVHECGLSAGATVDVIWSTWKTPEKAASGFHEVLLRRGKMDVLGKLPTASAENLDFSGTFAKQGLEREALAKEFISSFTPSLRVLDIRQCGFDPPTLLAIFEKLPGSLEELWASRNHFDVKALQSLRHLSLRVVDVGYSECSDLGPLPDLVCEKTKELILGDLEDLLPEIFTASLEKCPLLRHLDIYQDSLEEVFGFIATVPMLRKLEARRVDCTEEQLNQVLSRCTQLEHLCLQEISSSSSIQLLAKLVNLKVLQTNVATLVDEDSLAAPKGKGYPGNHREGPSIKVFTNQLVCEICQLKVDTLALGLVAEEDECPTTLSENVEPVVEALKNCMASCISLEAVGSRLCNLGFGLNSGSFSLIPSLLEVKHCCSNLVSLSINYFEQIDGKQLALLAAACPLLQTLSLNADEADFQREPIDEGVLGLGQHYHMLESLDMYDRIMKDPSQTLKTASAGWPCLRYLCIANCVIGDWKMEEMAELPQIIAKNCSKLQEFVVYNDTMRTLFEPVLERECLLYGPLLSYEDDSDDSESNESD